jgi:hypothetical protein
MDNDRKILAAWADAYPRYWGEGPTFGELPGGGTTVTFPDIPDPFGLSKIMIGSVDVFSGKPHMLDHLRRVGFNWNERGLINTVPLPSSFRPAMTRAGFPEAGYEPFLVALDQPDLLLGSWFGCMCDGLVIINVGTKVFYEQHVPDTMGQTFKLKPGSRLKTEDIAKHFMYVQHDTSKHAILLNLVPKSCYRAYGERIKTAFADIYPRWTNDPAYMPHVYSPITRFYENDLVIYCDRVFECVRRPEDFVATFADEANHKQLLEQLENKVALSLDPATCQSLKVGYKPPPYRVKPAKGQAPESTGGPQPAMS